MLKSGHIEDTIINGGYLTVLVAAGVIEKNGKILIAKRRKGDPLENKWEFPGGKLASNETPEECLRRELFEEFEVHTKVEDFICSSKFNYKHAEVELLAYKVSWLEGEFMLNEHEEIRWVPSCELIDYDFAEADIPVIKKLLRK